MGLRGNALGAGIENAATGSAAGALDRGVCQRAESDGIVIGRMVGSGFFEKDVRKSRSNCYQFLFRNVACDLILRLHLWTTRIYHLRIWRSLSDGPNFWSWFQSSVHWNGFGGTRALNGFLNHPILCPSQN
jgi:hypothetical protein